MLRSDPAREKTLGSVSGDTFAEPFPSGTRPLASHSHPSIELEIESSQSETVPFADWSREGLPDCPPEDDDGESESDLSGTILAQYRLRELAGKGSMGRVYRADHLGLHRPCALKILDPRVVARDPLLRDRFWAEARAVANIIHPHVVTIYNVGSDRGFHFIEMEYVPGGTSLKELVIREGPLDSYLATNLVRQVSLALEAAHAAGLVHRDVKPANVLLNSMQHAKLADFGLVHRASDAERLGKSLAGTPTFMAPELFQGGGATPKSDIYALGVMFYYLLSARLPYASDRIGRLIRLHLNAPIPDIRRLVPDVPDPIGRVIARCLAKKPEDRYSSCDELSDELRHLVRQGRMTDELVQEALRGLDCYVQGGREALRIVFRIPGDRLQEVYVESETGPSGERLLSIFSVCGPALPDHFEFALRLNDKLTYGSLSVRTVQGSPVFVMNRTFHREHVCSADIRKALLEISRNSDHIEQMLTDCDLY